MSASARTARIRDTVISRGFKVQNSNGIAATSLTRGVVPCLLNYNRLTYKLPKCQVINKPYHCPPVPRVIYDGGNPYSSGNLLTGPIYDGGIPLYSGRVYDGGSPLYNIVYNGGNPLTSGSVYNGGTPFSSGPSYTGGNPSSVQKLDGGDPIIKTLSYDGGGP